MSIPSTGKNPSTRTSEEFAAALKALEHKLTERDLRLLTFHLRSEEKRISARDTASFLGLTGPREANAAYGNLAMKFCRLLGRFETAEGKSDCVFLLADFDRDHPDGEVRWIMRPSFSKALISTGLIPKNQNDVQL